MIRITLITVIAIMSTNAELAKGIIRPAKGKPGYVVVVRDATGQCISSAKHNRRGRTEIASKQLAASGTTKPTDTEPQERESGNIDDLTAELLVLSSDDPKALEKVKRLVELLSDRLKDLDDAEMERLIDALLPAMSDPSPPAALDQARRNAAARANFINDNATLDAEQIHELYGSTARNKAALAARWRAAGKIFAVEYKGRLLYPAFQFVDGKPRLIVGKVLQSLGKHIGPWQTAIWFTSPNGWLRGKRPLDLLDTDPKAVIDAASDEAQPVVY